MKVAFGTTFDRPWGQTLGTVAMRKLTGQVTVRAEDGKTYSIGFVDGNVAAASSPLPNDSVARVALTSHFVSPIVVGEITRRLAAQSDRDEVDVVSEVGKLSAEHTSTLRKRLLVQRAARTFAIDRGEFEIHDELALPTVPGFQVTLGAVIFQGVRMNLSDERLAEDIRWLGSHFMLKPEVTDEELARFELDGVTPHILDALRAGANLAELEATHRDIEPRTLHSLLYALVCGAACEGTGGQAVDRTARSASPSTPPQTVTANSTVIKIDQPLVTRTTRPSVAPANTATTNIPRTNSQQGTQPLPTRTTSPTNAPLTRSTSTIPPRNVGSTLSPANTTTTNRTGSTISPPDTTTTIRTGTTNAPPLSSKSSQPGLEKRPGSGTAPGLSSHTQPPAVPRTITAPRTITERERAKKDVEVLIATRLAKLEEGVDYFAILGVQFEAPPEAVRSEYMELSRKLNPDSLTQLGVVDDSKSAQRVMAQVNAAFGVLNDPQKRREYVNACRRGEPTPIAPRARTGDLDKNELAAEAFESGETALRRDDILKAVEELGRAVTLAPTNFDYMAMLAWARFCAAGDKQAVYIETRKTLERAINKASKPVTARFFLGRVERILGHDREAMNHFMEVVIDEPNNKEAASEMRFLENKMARGTGPKR